jgi:hypothetical protein
MLSNSVQEFDLPIRAWCPAGGGGSGGGGRRNISVPIWRGIARAETVFMTFPQPIICCGRFRIQIAFDCARKFDVLCSGFISLVRSAAVSLHSGIICEIGAVREIASDSAVLVPSGAPWDPSSSAVCSVQDNEAQGERTSLPRGEFELGIPVCVFRETIK